MLQIATWNVNSLKVRLPQVLAWLQQWPDMGGLALQETKLENQAFPLEAFQEAGWHCVFSGQKAYNGVALLSRAPLTEIQINLPNFEDTQQRLIAASMNDIRIICVYIPNGQSIDSPKYLYKLAWLDALITWLKDELQRYPRLVLLGDYNIAPTDSDVYDAQAWQGQVLVSAAERERFQRLLDLGLNDSVRSIHPNENLFTWWDYRAAAFRRNLGLRIDHILLSSPLMANLQNCHIDRTPRKAQRPSDHTPLMVTLKNTAVSAQQ